MADREPQMDPGMATACRRAAALFTHWRRTEGASVKDASAELDTAGEKSILLEMADAPEEWMDLVLALLKVGTNLALAARDGQEDTYLAYVVRSAALDEVTGRG